MKKFYDKQNEFIMEVVDLFLHFERYQHYDVRELYNYIAPSVYYNQYWGARDDYNNLFAFFNWARVNQNIEKKLKATGYLEFEEWNCGDLYWQMEYVCKKDNDWTIKKWKNHWFEMVGPEQKVPYLKCENDEVKDIRYKTTKEHWKCQE